MSLLELIVAIVIMGVVMGAAMQFFVGQSKSFRRGASDVTLLQNIRFGADLLNQHFRSVGANVVGDQPPIIYVDDHVLSFNADYATNTPGDLNAIYYTPNAPNAEVEAIRGTSAITVPGQSSLTYPTGDWLAAPGVMSPAEMITFWFEPDTETVRSDDYVLFRQVNDAQPEAVVRNILKDTVPFFRFLYLRDSSANLSIDTVTATQLPFDYVSTPNDTTGKAPMFKGLRAVIVSYIVTNGLTGPAERTRPLSLVAPFPNMANRELKTCGNDPVNMSAPTIALDADGHSVDITWTADGDETSGERDIVNYLLWRRVAGVDSTWHAPFVAIPAGSPPTYTFVDSSVPQDTTGATVPWEYAVAAQDCTPSYSDPILAAGTVPVPPAP
jgi:type II secretory pathway pseudopilin PulG